jgi:hypothetical protein
MVHAAGDRIGARLDARSHQRERGGRLVDQRSRELDERSSKASDWRRTSITTASTSPRSASGKSSAPLV